MLFTLILPLAGTESAASFFHFDPVTLIVLVAGFIGTWYNLRSTSKWHTSWIRKHDEECTEQRRVNNEILTELKVNTSRLTVLSEATVGRVDRLETQMDSRR